MHRTTLRRLALPLALAVPLLAGGCGGAGGNTCAAGLTPGQLVITELLADPEGADGDGVEWFEIYNAGDTAVRLKGVGLEVSKLDGSEGDGHRILGDATIEPGAYMTFGRIADDARPPHIDYGFGDDLQMGNDSGKLRIVCGDVVVDETDYEELEEGHTRSLDGKIDPPDAEANDDPAAWCPATEAYSETEFGTPGTANGVCPLTAAGCGQCYEGDELRDVVAPLPGQLVISEVMANARTADPIGEWFEVRVVDGPVDLNCLQYGVNTTLFATGDEKAVKTLVFPQCRTAEVGEHLVFAKEAWEGADFALDFTSLVDSASDSNPMPGAFIAYDGELLDEVHYPKPDDGVAWSLDPDLASDTANDDPASWCDAVTALNDGSFGTPGEENPQCPQASVPGQCLDGDVLRDIRYFAPGELLITEVFPDPGPMIADATLAEWFELYAGVDADLNGLAFGKDIDTLTFTIDVEPCVPVTAGSFVLIAASDDPAGNGMLPAPDWVDDAFTLTNDNSTLLAAVVDTRAMTTTPLDSVAWATTDDGVATQLPLALIPTGDPPFDVTINDDPAQWCDALVPFGVGDLGTPKAENTACDGPPPGDQCLDPETMTLRDIVHPQSGEILITEFLANPNAVTDANGEWFEVFAAADFDLNGLEIGKLPPAVSETIAAEGCIEVTAGSHALLAKRGTPAAPPDPMDPAGNGGLPDADWTFASYGLSNSDTGIFVGVAGEVLDAVAYTSTVDGAATQLTADCTANAPLDPACNDDPAAWCTAEAPYGLGDLGTPRAGNAVCVAPPGPGECFDEATMKNRALVVPQPGDLVITEFLANPSGTETDKEWVEVWVENAVDLNGLKVLGTADPVQPDIDAAVSTCGGPTCRPAAAGSYVLLARKSDPALNGGLPTVDCTLPVSLSNSPDGVALAHGPTKLHGVGWVSAQDEDLATMLDPGSKDIQFIDADMTPWCQAQDSGTPKQENPSCP